MTLSTPANTRVVIRFLCHDVIHWKTATSYDKYMFVITLEMAYLDILLGGQMQINLLLIVN